MELLDRIRRTLRPSPAQSYARLDPNVEDFSTEDGSQAEEKSIGDRRGGRGCLVCKFAALVLIISITAGAIVTLTTTPARKGVPESEWISCGHTSEEAVASNCVFDIMMNGWIPHQCYNHELSEQYIAEHKEFRFYADRTGYEQLSLEELRKGEYRAIFTTKNHHYAHCAYVWELQGIALAGGQYIDEHSMNQEHTAHCASLLLRSHEITDEPNVGNGSKVPQVVELGFMRCRAMW